MVEFGGLGLEVLHLPGHAPGQIGLWNKASGSCYPADLLHYPSPLGPYPVGNAESHWNSIQRCKALEPTLFLEGHGLGAYDKDASMRRILHLETQQRQTSERIQAVLRRAGEAADDRGDPAGGDPDQGRARLRGHDRTADDALLRLGLHADPPRLAHRPGQGEADEGRRPRQVRARLSGSNAPRQDDTAARRRRTHTQDARPHRAREEDMTHRKGLRGRGIWWPGIWRQGALRALTSPTGG